MQFCGIFSFSIEKFADGEVEAWAEGERILGEALASAASIFFKLVVVDFFLHAFEHIIRHLTTLQSS